MYQTSLFSNIDTYIYTLLHQFVDRTYSEFCLNAACCETLTRRNRSALVLVYFWYTCMLVHQAISWQPRDAVCGCIQNRNSCTTGTHIHRYIQLQRTYYRQLVVLSAFTNRDRYIQAPKVGDVVRLYGGRSRRGQGHWCRVPV